MYITINDIKGEKRIDLSYPIHSKKEIAVVSMHISNSQILLHRSIEFLLKTSKKIVLNKGVYMDKELNSQIGMKLKSQMLDSHNDIQRTNKLVNGTKITISLKELSNYSDNLEDGKPSNTLFMYFVTSPEYFTHFEPQSPQYKKLKNHTITSLTLAITDQNNDITDGLEVTVVLHIR